MTSGKCHNRNMKWFFKPRNSGMKEAHAKHLLYDIKLAIWYSFCMLSAHAIQESENLCFKRNKTHQYILATLHVFYLGRKICISHYFRWTIKAV